MSIREVEALDGVEIAEWRIRLTSNPPADLWYMFAVICQMIHNTSMGCKKARPVEDFLPQFRRMNKR